MLGETTQFERRDLFSLDDPDLLPPPNEIAAEIVESLEAALDRSIERSVRMIASERAATVKDNGLRNPHYRVAPGGRGHQPVSLRACARLERSASAWVLGSGNVREIFFKLIEHIRPTFQEG